MDENVGDHLGHDFLAFSLWGIRERSGHSSICETQNADVVARKARETQKSKAEHNPAIAVLNPVKSN